MFARSIGSIGSVQRALIRARRSYGCRGNGGRSIGPVMAATGEQAHVLAVAAHDQPIAIVLDLVDPIGPGRRPCSPSWDARRDEAVDTNPNHDLTGRLKSLRDRGYVVRRGDKTQLAVRQRSAVVPRSVVECRSDLPLGPGEIIVLDPQLGVVLLHEIFNLLAALRGLVSIGVRHRNFLERHLFRVVIEIA
jgi:hypothetical protein